MTNILISIGRGEKKQVITSAAGPTIKVQGQETKPSSQSNPKMIDIVFVIDTTGSMSDKIQGLLATCEKFVDDVSSMNLDYQVAIVAFGDLTVPNDSIVRTGFTQKVSVIKDSLRNVPRYGGGANEGESSLEAMDKAMQSPFRQGAVKVIILITDEPALQHQMKASDIINRLRQQEFLTFTIAPAIEYYQTMAKSNGGKWYQISSNTDFTDLLEMFKQVSEKVSQVVSDVYKLGDGSVANYLKLNPPQ
jgi:Mg-chelatase subunit ChlD